MDTLEKSTSMLLQFKSMTGFFEGLSRQDRKTTVSSSVGKNYNKLLAAVKESLPAIEPSLWPPTLEFSRWETSIANYSDLEIGARTIIGIMEVARQPKGVRLIFA